MQYKQTTPLTFVLSRQGRGYELSCAGYSPIGDLHHEREEKRIPSPLAGEGRVRGISD
jgi:hypothetical protein